MNKKFISIALLSAGLIFTTSCGEEKADESENQEQAQVKPDGNSGENTELTESEMLEGEESEEEEIQLPTALQVAQMMNKEGLSYSEGLTHDPDKAGDYTSEVSKKLNFGIYSADLAYAVMNEKFSDAQAYMGVIKKLGSETGLAKIFDSEDLLESFEANMEDRQGMMDVLVDINWRTEEIFDEDPEAKKESTVYFSGAWIEGMYIGSQLLEETGNEDLGTTIVEQMNVLNSVLKGLNQLEESGLDELKANLKDLKATYDSLESVKTTMNNEDGIYTNPVLTKDELHTMTVKIDKIRTDIVNG
jgi:hypothetical protein